MKNERAVSAVAAMLVLAVFAVGAVSVLLGGAAAYRRLTQQNQAAYESRTAAQYLTTKLHQAQSPDAVQITSFGDIAALELTVTVDGAEYINKIYCHDGWLMELFCSKDNPLQPEDGEKILPAAGLELQRRGGMLEVKLRLSEEETQTFQLWIRGWQT